MDYTAHYHSRLGGITMASDGTALVGLWFDGQKYFGSTLEAKHEPRPDLPIFYETRCWLDIYFGGHEPNFTPPLVMRGSDFRKAVWRILLEIPFGQTMTYGEIAHRVAVERGLQSMSAQAIGGAVGHNPISIIVPCHRIIAADGGMTGYAGGIDRKIWLLMMEKAIDTR